MSYTLQAIVALADVDSVNTLPVLRSVPLKCGVEMYPLGNEAVQHFGIPFCPLTDGGDIDLPLSIQGICQHLSQSRTVAYIEAEIFGGTGTQACILFQEGRQIDEIVVSSSAINHALIALGVNKGTAFDHFEAVGLGQHRSTNQWLN